MLMVQTLKSCPQSQGLPLMPVQVNAQRHPETMQKSLLARPSATACYLLVFPYNISCWNRTCSIQRVSFLRIKTHSLT